MSTYRRREGFVDITTDELAAKCSRCNKVLVWKNTINLALWKELLKHFVKNHRTCTKGDS